MEASDILIVEREEHVALVRINRPDKLNALNSTIIRDLTRLFAELDAEAERPRVAILTGSGDKAFVAGADIAEMSMMTVAQAKEFGDSGHRMTTLLERLHFPVIAAVNGFALGGGCELALACDFIYASDKAKFGLPEVNLGIMPGFGGSQRLTRRVGAALARELIYTGDFINAERALAIGLVNAVVPHAELLPKVREIAAKIAAKSPLSIAACKRAVERGLDADLATANELEVTAFSALFGSEDQREGTQAFLEKRPATFNGR